MRGGKETAKRQKDVIWARRDDTEHGELFDAVERYVRLLFCALWVLDFHSPFGRLFLDASCLLSSVCPFSFWQTRLCPYLASHLSLNMMLARCWLVGLIFTDIISVCVFVGSFSSIR